MSVGLGVGVFIAGLVVVTLALLVLRFMARTQSAPQAVSNSSSVSPLTKSSNEAVLVLQPGGRVEYISMAARAYFNLRDDEPFDLERLARHVRPSDDFIDLCVTPGARRVSVDGKPVELASFEVPGVYPRMLISMRGKDSSSPALMNGNNNEGSDEILRVATEFSQGIAASLDLDTTVRYILDYV